MKQHHHSRFILALFALLTLVPHGSVLASVELTAEQILDNYIQAAGGYEAMDAVKSLHRVGDLTFESTFTGVLEGTIEIVLRPRERIHTKSDLGAFTTITAWDGTNGWEQGPQGFRILEGAELKRLRTQSDLLFASELARSPDVLTERQSDREIDGIPHHVLTVREGTETVLTLYLDAKTGLVSQTIMPIQIAGVGDAVAVMDFWDYRPHQGIMLPDTIALAIEGLFSTQMVFSETVINGPIDERLFAPPQQSTPTGQSKQTGR